MDASTPGPVVHGGPHPPAQLWALATPQASGSESMSLTYGDPLDVLLDLQRALEARLESGWLRDLTTSMGPFPPINSHA
jgi:hypothetical protein